MKLLFLRTAAFAQVLVLVLVLDAAVAAAQAFDIPANFAATAEDAPAPGGEWRAVLSIQPSDGAFSELSRISLREVVGEVRDADTWLRSRLTADMPDEADAGALLESPDSPFGDPAFQPLRDAIPRLFEGVQALSRMPLSFCEGPNAAYNAAGELRELYCLYQIGPFRQYLVLRLQQVGGHWYYTEVRAMNERRFRQLLAIANTFRISA